MIVIHRLRLRCRRRSRCLGICELCGARGELVAADQQLHEQDLVAHRQHVHRLVVVQHLARVLALVENRGLDVADKLLRQRDDELDEVVRRLVVAKNRVHACDVAEEIDRVLAMQQRLDVADVRVDDLLRVLGDVLEQGVVEDDREGQHGGQRRVLVLARERGGVVGARAAQAVDERARDGVARVDDAVLGAGLARDLEGCVREGADPALQIVAPQELVVGEFCQAGVRIDNMLLLVIAIFVVIIVVVVVSAAKSVFDVLDVGGEEILDPSESRGQEASGRAAEAGRCFALAARSQRDAW